MSVDGRKRTLLKVKIMCPSGLLQNVGHIFLPGDVIVVPNDSCTADKVVLGPGLKNICDTIHVTAPGRLSSKEPNIYWIECHAKRVRFRDRGRVYITTVAWKLLDH